MWQLHMKMKQVYISYNQIWLQCNGCCCVPGPVNNPAIFGSQKNGPVLIELIYLPTKST